MIQVTHGVSLRGRRRDDGLTLKILDAAMHMLATDGFSAFTMDRLATEVPCGKGSLYRRWENQDELIGALIVREMKIGTLPDTGNLVDDLLEHASVNMDNQSTSPFAFDDQNFWSLITIPTIRPHVSEHFLSKRRNIARSILRRAQSRGEIRDDADLDFWIDALSGVIFYRNSLRGVETTEDQLRPLVVAIVESISTH